MERPHSSTRTAPAGCANVAARRYRLLLAAILALAFALRVGNAAIFQGLGSPPDAGAQPDQLDYETLAFHLSEGRGFSLNGERPTALRPPGTSWALLPAYLVFGRSFAAGRIWWSVISTATCFVAALFAARAFGRGVALLAALWLAVYPGHFYYPMHFLSETPFAFWLALACFGALATVQSSRTSWPILAGLALAMATLTRPQALLIFPLAWVGALLFRRGAERPPWRALVLGSLAFAALLAPWLARNHALFGKASLSSIGGATFWGAHNEIVTASPLRAGRWVEVTALVDAEHPLEGDEFEVEAACWRYGKEFIREHPGLMPRLLAAKLWNFLRPFEPVPSRLAYWIFGLGWILSAPLILAGFVLAWRAHRPAALVLLAPIFATFATVLVFYGSARFRDGLSAIVAAPVGLAAWRALERVRRRPPCADRE